MHIDTLAIDGIAKVGQSLFPTEVQIESLGMTGCRFMLIDNPDGSGWVAGVWQASQVGGVPVQTLLEPVAAITQYQPGQIAFTLADGRHVLIRPGRGCSSCGGAAGLRQYNPFGFAVNLARVPGPDQT